MVERAGIRTPGAEKSGGKERVFEKTKCERNVPWGAFGRVIDETGNH